MGSGGAPRLNRWTVLAASTVAMLVGGLPLVVFTFSVFLKPLVEDTGWGRAEASAAISLYLYVLAFATPVTGLLMDRFGVRRPLIASILLSVAVLASISLATSLPAFLLAFALAGLVAGGVAPLPYCKVVVGWFDRQRGLALGIVNSGQGLGGAIMPLVAAWLLTRFGWRGGYVGLALLLLVIALPMAVLFVREHPKEKPATLVAAGSDHVPLGDVLTSRAFWIIVATTVALSFSVAGVLPHLAALLSDRGYSLGAAAGIMAAVGLAGIVGRLVTGGLVDLFFAPRVAFGVFAVTALGIFILWLGSPAVPPVIGAVLMGAGIGAESDLTGFLVSRYFAKAIFARVFGLVFFSLMIGQSAGAYVLGLYFDRTGSYDAMLFAFAILVLAGGALALALGPYRYQSPRTA